MKKTHKLFHLEFLRCMAILLVVLVHVTSEPLSRWRGSLGGFFPLYVLGYTLGHMGVPLFLMISGALLLDPHREMTLKKLYGRMIPRILIPLVVWGYCFSLMKQWFAHRTLTLSMLRKALIKVLNGKSWTHLWYLYMLLGIYLLLPVLRALVVNLSEQQERYMIGVLLFLGSVLPTVNRVLKMELTLHQPKPLCYVTMFLLGYFLFRRAERLKQYGTRWQSEKCSRCIVYAALVSMAILIIYSFLASPVKKKAYMKLAQYTDLFVILAAAGVFFLTCLYVNACRSQLIARWICSLGACSFGIYLLHPVVLNFLYKELSISPETMHPGMNLLLFWIPLILVCHLIVWIMRRIPVIKKLV